jgi:hypothetical protein
MGAGREVREDMSGFRVGRGLHFIFGADLTRDFWTGDLEVMGS